MVTLNVGAQKTAQAGSAQPCTEAVMARFTFRGFKVPKVVKDGIRCGSEEDLVRITPALVDKLKIHITICRHPLKPSSN